MLKPALPLTVCQLCQYLVVLVSKSLCFVLRTFLSRGLASRGNFEKI